MMTVSNHDAEFLFLDFDGVLTFGVDKMGNYTKSITLLQNYLLDNPSIQVVFTTTWRLGREISELASLFPENIRSRFVGKTPVLQTSMREAIREKEVLAFLKEYAQNGDHKKSPLRWAILDDLAVLFSASAKNLVIVKHPECNCLTKEDLDKVTSLFETQRKAKISPEHLIR